MIYKCDNCGLVFGEHKVATRRELVGEFWGAPAYQEIRVCPDCRSEDIDAYPDKGEGEENE